MSRPQASTSWSYLAKFGFSRVINLIEQSPSYDPSPLELAISLELEDLYGGRHPPDRDAEHKLIKSAVDVLVQLISNGEGTLVHCHGGTGRTGTVIGCALTRLGFVPEDVISALDAIHKTRGRDGWPESEWQAQVVREFV
jgi:protein-tyrosine phosphatase